MPTSVPQVSSTFALASVEVARPVSGPSHAGRLANDTLFLLGYCVEPVASLTLPRSTTSGNTAHVAYWRSPYTQLVKVTFELWRSGSTDSVVVTARLNGTAVSLLYSRITNGVTALPCPPSNRLALSTYTFFLDVTGLTAGVAADLSLQWTSVVGGAGISKVTVHEVPLADSDTADAPTTEPSLNGAWALPPNTITDGTASTPTGLVRFEAQLDLARTGMRLHRQVATLESTALAWQTTSTTQAAFTYPSIAGGYEPRLALRAQRYYDTATPEPDVLTCRYLAAAGGKLVATINGVGVPFTLPASASWAQLAPAALGVPTSTTDQEIAGITFEGLTNNAGSPLYVSQVALATAQP